MGRKAVFLDRDGVINHSLVLNGVPYAPVVVDDFEVYPGVPGSIGLLKQLGFLVIVVTNQPDLATGKQTQASLDLIHQKLINLCLIDDVKICPHTDAHACSCRKPAPGMLLKSAQEWGLDLSESYMVGDRWRDVAAGQAAGCKQIFFVDHGYQEKKPVPPFTLIHSLEECVQIIMKNEIISKVSKDVL